MNLEEIKRELDRRVEELARRLFPRGKRSGNHWCVGSIAGEPGRSFKICIAGEKAGLWGDFDGTQKHHRSLVDLWMEKRGVDFSTALQECANWLGVSVDNSTSVGLLKSQEQPASTNTSFDWQACVDAFQGKHVKRLAQWRGYSVDLCSWLRDQGLIGMWKKCIAFPVRDDAGLVIGCHYRVKNGDWFYTKGCAAHPGIIGSLAEADHVHLFESPWDALAVCDKLRLHDQQGHAVVITRGAGNGAAAGKLIPKKAEGLAWKQNDQLKSGKRAGNEWLQSLVTSTDSLVRCVTTPAPFKDVNEWTLKGGADSADLLLAIRDATQAPGAAARFRESVTSLNSQVLSSVSDDDYPYLPADAAFYGPAGKIVRLIEPHTEADPVALLVQFLVAFGNVLGHDLYFVADGAHHPLTLDAVLVGQSSKGRKGTALSHVARIMRQVDPEWSANCVMSGLSSGEGLISAVCDPIEEKKPIRAKGRFTGEYETFIANHGVEDKRLLVIEAEFANVLKVMSREGNTLSPIIRCAWDSGTLRIMVKISPMKATDAHISIIGHITRDELRRLLTQTESANGFANRFLWLAVKRSKCLPDGGAIESVNFDDIIAELQAVISFAEDFVELKRDAEARELWHKVYPRLSEGKPGMLGAVTGRAEAQVMRLSAIYAVLDKSRLIRREHLQAALALWDYCERSAAWVFGTSTGDRNADKILRALQHSPDGMTKTEISVDVFNRHASSAEIDEALRLLHGLNMVRFQTETTGGAPLERWFPSAEAAK